MSSQLCSASPGDRDVALLEARDGCDRSERWRRSEREMETIVARDGNDGWNELDELMEAIVARAGRVDGNDRDEKWTN